MISTSTGPRSDPACVEDETMYSPPILHQLAVEASMPNGDERIKSYANPQAREDPWME